MPETEKPKINIPLTMSAKIIEAFGLLVLIAFWIVTLVHFKQLPEIIPTHFSGNGEPDGYGPKWTIITLPIVGTALYLMLTLFSRFPHKMNYMVTITEANAEKQYASMTQMIRVLKIMVLLVFFVLDYQTIQVAMKQPDIFGHWFLLLVFGMVFVPIFYFLIQLSKNA